MRPLNAPDACLKRARAVSCIYDMLRAILSDTFTLLWFSCLLKADDRFPCTRRAAADRAKAEAAAKKAADEKAAAEAKAQAEAQKKAAAEAAAQAKAQADAAAKEQAAAKAQAEAQAKAQAAAKKAAEEKCAHAAFGPTIPCSIANDEYHTLPCMNVPT